MSGFGGMRFGAALFGAGQGGGSGVPKNPIITNFVPARGEDILSNGTIQFDITDEDSAIDLLAVGISFQNGDGSETFDLAHDNHNFRGLYTSSIRTVITDGFRYTMGRDGGWPSTPTIEWFVVDTTSLEGIIVD